MSRELWLVTVEVSCGAVGTLYSNQRMVEVFLYCTQCFLLFDVPQYHLEGELVYRFIVFTF